MNRFLVALAWLMGGLVLAAWLFTAWFYFIAPDLIRLGMTP